MYVLPLPQFSQDLLLTSLRGSADMVETHSYTLEEIALAFGSEVHLPRLERIARDQEGRTERSREVDEENKK